MAFNSSFTPVPRERVCSLKWLAPFLSRWQRVGGRVRRRTRPDAKKAEVLPRIILPTAPTRDPGGGGGGGNGNVVVETRGLYAERPNE